MKQIVVLVACWLPLSLSALPTSETSGSILNSFSNPFTSKTTHATTPTIQYINPKITIEYELNGTKVCYLQTSNHKTAYIDHDNQLKFMELPEFYIQKGELGPKTFTMYLLSFLIIFLLGGIVFASGKSNNTKEANNTSTTN